MRCCDAGMAHGYFCISVCEYAVKPLTIDDPNGLCTFDEVSRSVQYLDTIICFVSVVVVVVISRHDHHCHSWHAVAGAGRVRRSGRAVMHDEGARR